MKMNLSKFGLYFSMGSVDNMSELCVYLLKIVIFSCKKAGVLFVILLILLVFFNALWLNLSRVISQYIAQFIFLLLGNSVLLPTY